MKRRVMLTVDVEAQPTRAATSHVQRLIYGRFGGDSEFGIGRMFDIADRYDLRLTCFLDYAEQFLYGDELLEVGRYIRSRNHDLQVHLHPEFIPRSAFDAAGVKYGVDMFKTDRTQAAFLIDIATGIHYKVSPTPPVAFRGGGYRYGPEILNQLAENKFFFNSGYNPSRKNQVFNIGSQKQFRWAEGVAEFPISCVHNFKNTGRIFDYNFNADVLMKGSIEECVAKHEEFLEQYFELHGDNAIAVMVMHSWSFVNINADGQYDAPNQGYVDKFDAILRMLSEKYAVVTAGDVASMDGVVSPDDAVSYKPNNNIMNELNETKMMELIKEPSCSVCGAQYDKFTDFNGPKRKCSVCGSLERQRAFGSLLKSDSWKLDLQNSRFLLVSPSVSERRLFSELAGVKLSTLDIRAEVKPDVVADLCDMSAVPDGSFDVVYACHVLSHVHDLPAALSELSRIIAQDGVFINYEPISKGAKTKELIDVQEISAHYGLEAFEKYKIGRFRNFGDQDIEKIFSPYFEREVFQTVDEVTGAKVAWSVWKKKDSSALALSTKIYSYSLRDCPICHDSLVEVESDENCKHCGSRARLRSLTPFVDEFLLKEFPAIGRTSRPLLAFAMTGAEQKAISKAFQNFKSVSLFGTYAAGHEIGVDMRDLSRYESNSFAGVFGCLLFDYFVEHELALQECFRVTAPGGVFFTHIAPYRIVDGDSPPFLKGKIKSRTGYFEYLPEKTELPDVKVGRDWFAEAMNRVGFQAAIVRIEDAVPGMVSEWFVGIKPGSIDTNLLNSAGRKEGIQKIRAKASTVFHSVVPFDADKQASLTIDLVEGMSSSLLFLEDNSTSVEKNGPNQEREIVAANGSRDLLYASYDNGESWVAKYDSVRWDSKIRATFPLRDGGHLVRTFSGRMYHFDPSGSLVSSQSTAQWHWHGSQGIGESSSGTVMYGEYAPLQIEDGIQSLSVWRYRPRVENSVWERIFTLPAAARPPEGQLRHFHVCRPNPANPTQWVLASGDIGVHNRLWLSNDDGDNWTEIKLTESTCSNFPKSFPQALRFTQFSALSNGDLIWGTDDTGGSGRAALVQLSTITGDPVFHFRGWLGRNCIRNISSCGNDLFLLISESVHDATSADMILYDATRNRIVSLLLPNISQMKNTVTDSVGSASMADGLAFYPALGAVLMDSGKRGIFRIGLEEILP
jgi:ubiquinone/menaquinone biosynthesis C-methylase UbiE